MVKTNYLINKKVFATLEEAQQYFKEYCDKTGILLGISATNREVTHFIKLNVIKGDSK